MKKILLIDDENSIARLVGSMAGDAGYAFAYAEDGAEGLVVAEREAPDLVIMDVMMPRMDGFTTCRLMRERGITCPVIFLSAKGDIVDKGVGFQAGGDDYMVKPFGVLELSARVRSLLRRSRREDRSDELAFDGIRVDRRTREVNSGGRPVELTLKEYELLMYLLENCSRVVTRDELLNRIWGYGYDGETRTLDMHIRTLRQKLGADGGACIRTVRGVGYRMVKPETGENANA